MNLFQMLAGGLGGNPLGGGQEQSGLQRLLQPEMLLAMGSGMMGNQGNFQNLGQGFANMVPVMMQQKQNQKDLQTRNRTLDYFKANAPEYAAMIEGGIEPSEAWTMYHKQRMEKNDPYKAVGGHIYDTSTGTWISPPQAEGPEETGLQPVMLRNPETGEVMYAQPTKSGKLLPSQVPEGFQPYDPYTKAFENKRGMVEGGGQGEAAETYASMMSKMPGLISTVQKLDDLAGKATYTLGGQAIDWGMKQAGMEPREAAVARAEYIAIVDNQVLPLLRDTFGAQFTEREGDTLRKTLGDPDKSPAEKQAVLKAFIEQKMRDVEALAARTGQPAYTPPGPTPGAMPGPQGGQRLRFNPQTGRIE